MDPYSDDSGAGMTVGEGGSFGTGFEQLWKALVPIGRDDRTGGYRRYSWTPAHRSASGGSGTRPNAATSRGGRRQRQPGRVVAARSRAGGRRRGHRQPSGLRARRRRLRRSARRGLGIAALDAIRADETVGGAEVTRPLGDRGVRGGGGRAVRSALPRLAAADRCAGAGPGAGVARRRRHAAHRRDGAGRRARRPRPLRPVAAPSAFVELHVEQGRALADLGAPVGLARAIWPHGR